MDIYILRHGKAEERLLTVKSDSNRKLTEAGKKELHCISKAIKDMDLELDYIASSPLLRAKQTAQIASKYVKRKKRPIAYWDELKPEFDAGAILQKLSTLNPDASVMLVGHEPLLSDLIGAIISQGSHEVSISLKKGGFAHMQGSATNSAVTGILRSILTPKQLRRLCK